MLQTNPDRRVRTGAAVPYWPLWSACFLGFGAIGMTMQVMPAYAHDWLGANAITAGLAVTIGSLATMISRPVSGRFADQSGGRRVAMIGAILGPDRWHRPCGGDEPADPGSCPAVSRRR